MRLLIDPLGAVFDSTALFHLVFPAPAQSDVAVRSERVVFELEVVQDGDQRPAIEVHRTLADPSIQFELAQ